MKSIYIRNFTATVMTVALCLIVLVSSFLGLGKEYVIESNKDGMTRCCDSVADMASAFSGSYGLESLSIKIELTIISNSTGNHIFITDSDGKIVCCSDNSTSCEHLGRVLDTNDLNFDDKDSAVFYSSFDDIYPQKRYAIASEIESDDETIGYVFVTREKDDMLSGWKAYSGIAVAIPLAILAIAMLICYFYSRKMAQPLDEMTEASRKFARGDFSVRVKQQTDPTAEMGALIDSFNKMADSLEQAEERRSQFISNVSHELRTPMTTIAGFADGILDGTISHEEQDKYLVLIRDETRRLARLVREMLDVSQIKAHMSDMSRRSSFDITELVLQTLLGFESRAAEKHLDVDPQLPEDTINVFADKDAITRVIYNLIDNAVKFSFPDTCITLRVYRADGKAYVSVKDRGETIPPDDLPFIFDRFHKSDKSRSLDKDGVGLGLSFVKDIINSHDEDIAVKSENNETEFVFTLPLAEVSDDSHGK